MEEEEETEETEKTSHSKREDHDASESKPSEEKASRTNCQTLWRMHVRRKPRPGLGTSRVQATGGLGRSGFGETAGTEAPSEWAEERTADDLDKTFELGETKCRSRGNVKSEG